jgi:hypothetical protein
VDLRVFFRVVGRFKLLVGVGVALACILAFLSLAKVSVTSSPHLAYRDHEIWQSNARLLLTEPGFKWGDVNPGPLSTDVEGRLPSLAIMYSTFISSDAVRRLLLEGGRVHGAVSATPLGGGPDGRQLLPVVEISAVEQTPLGAMKLATRAAAALQRYVHDEQVANDVDVKRRVELQLLNTASLPVLVEPRSKTMPIVVFLAVLFVTLSAAFLLENLRPRPIPIREVEIGPLARVAASGAKVPESRATN